MATASTRAWLQGALWFVAAAALVALWWFPDAISRLRSAGQPYAAADPSCDFAAGPCVARFPDGTEVSLQASPQPAPSGEPVALQVVVIGDATPAAVEIQGVEMAMGFLRLPLTADGDRWTATANLPVCTTERMQWKADVVLSDRVAGFILWSTRT